MDIEKMREDLENYCKGKCCEDCPLDGICSTGRYWTNEKEEDIIELWKTAFPNKSIPVTEEEKETVSEILSLKSQLEQQKKAYATLMDQFNKLQAEKNNLQAELKIARSANHAEAVKDLREEMGKLQEIIVTQKKEITDLSTDGLLARVRATEKRLGEKEQENKKLKENNDILRKAYDEQEKRAVEWCHKYNAAIDKKNQLSALIGEFVRRAVET